MAWAEAYGQGFVHDAIYWFLHKFIVDLVDTLGERRSSLDVPLLLFSTQHVHLSPSVHWPLQLRAFPLGHHIMDRLCQELPAYFARAEGISFKAEHGRSG